jgi:hypothetical protein
MSDRLETIVVVTDKGSQTFVKVGDSATKMGTQIDKGAKTGEQGLTRLNKAGAATASAFTTLGSVIGIAARANAEAEASQARLETAIDNTGHSVLEYQDQLDAASKKALQLGFDDEDAADSIAKMTTATGDAQTAIDDLSIAEDIARARKIDLASATNIVIAAEQGRTGALKRVGIEVDATMSKEQVMDALRAKFAGNADAYAQTSAAGFDRVKNAAENMFESFGSHLGPFQEIVQLLPGLSAGTVGVSAAMGALAPEMTGAAVAATALDLALGPVGVTALAIGAGLALYEFSKSANEDFVPSIDAASASAEALDQTLKNLIATSSVEAPLAKQIGDSFDYITAASNDYETQVDSLTQALEKAKKATGENTTVVGEDANGYPIIASNIEVAQKALDDYVATQGKNKVSAEEMESAQGAVNDILQQQGPAGDDARASLADLYDSQQKGIITWQEYLQQIVALDKLLPDLVVAHTNAAAATDKNTKSTKAGSDANKEYINTATGYRQSLAVLGDQFTTLDGQAKTLTTDHASLANAIATGNEMFKAEQEAAKQTTAAFFAQAESIGTLDSELEKLIAADVSTWAERTANRVLKSTEGLDSLMSVIIDGTKNLSGQSQNLNDWAIDLINVAGSYGKIDDLLAHGQITLTTYNQAQEAGTRIFADNAAVQEDLLRIQAKQAPLLADAADAQAKYVDQLADLPAQQQLVALGWMDQNEAMKANAALALAAAAANGEYGDAGEAAATAAITAQARADPAFAAMLEDMGVISMGADGTITVNFPTANQVHDDTVNLTASIDALTIALGGVPPNVNSNVTVTGVDSASAAVAGYSYLLDTVNGKSVYTSVYVDALGPGLRLTPGYELGGIVPHAQNGMITGDSRTVIMNESGPEAVRLPTGALVYPHGASEQMARNAARSGGTIHIHNMTVVANNPRDFSDQMRSFNFGYGARS